MTAIPETARPIPGYNNGYLITPCGVVWSRKWRGPRSLNPFPGRTGPRVRLYRNNKESRPMVATLLRQVFGRPEPMDVSEYVREQYADDPEAMKWADSVFG